MDKKNKKPEAVKKSETTNKNESTKEPEIKETTESKEVDIHCACAMGDLSEFAPVKPVKETKTKMPGKISQKDYSKNESSINKK